VSFLLAWMFQHGATPPQPFGTNGRTCGTFDFQQNTKLNCALYSCP
jgi:hypothetical protein